MADMAREWYPELKDRVVSGNPGKYSYQDPGVYTISNEKSKKVLGIKCKSLRKGFCSLKIDPRRRHSRMKWIGFWSLRSRALFRPLIDCLGVIS
jgi:hypothetical protein